MNTLQLDLDKLMSQTHQPNAPTESFDSAPFLPAILAILKESKQLALPRAVTAAIKTSAGKNCWVKLTIGDTDITLGCGKSVAEGTPAKDLHIMEHQDGGYILMIPGNRKEITAKAF